MSTQCRQIALVASIINILTAYDTKLTESPMEFAKFVIAQTLAMDLWLMLAPATTKYEWGM